MQPPSTSRPADTSPEVWAMMRQQWRAMTVEERLADTLSQIEHLSTLAVAGIRALHPTWTDDEVDHELRRRRYGRTIADIASGRARVS